MFISLSLGIVTGLLFIILHFLLLNRNVIQRQVVALVSLFISCSFLYAVVYFVKSEAGGFRFLSPLWWMGLVNGWFIYSAILGIYLGMVFYGLKRSVSVRIICELKKAGPKGLTLEEFDLVYPLKEMVKERLKTMVEAEWLKRQGRYFTPTLKGRQLSKLFSFIQRMVKIGPRYEPQG